MTTTRQHIEDLDAETWAEVTRRAAVDAVAAAKRHGSAAPPELVRVAAMSERALVEHRERSGPARKQLSPLMQLVEADHLRRVAEGSARDAHQDKADADAAAAVARADADQSARAATAARERARSAEAHAAHKEVERAAEQRAAQQVQEQLRGELEQVRANAAAEVAAAREQARAAEARAEQRTAERAEERAIAQETLGVVRAELEQVRADASAEVAAAREQARAAEARAEQRAAERVTERAAAQETLGVVRAELERVRVDAAAEVDAAGEHAVHAMAAAQQATDAQIARVRAEADQRVSEAHDARARAEADADEARRQAQIALAAARLLTIPIPPSEVRTETRRIENALSTVHQIDYLLEVGMAEDVEAEIAVDVELVRSLTWTVLDQTGDLSRELGTLPTRFSTQSHVEAAAGYATAAAGAYRAFLQRIDVTTQRLRGRNWNPDAEIVDAVSAMLADPLIQEILHPRPASR